MMISHAIYTKEDRNIIVAIILGAFIHSDMEGTVRMLLKGAVTKLIVKLEPMLY